MPHFSIGDHDFLLDGEPHRVLSGAIHYFRVHPDQWADRIRKARLMGLNTIETYVAWNAHEPRRGEWIVDSGLDLARFLDLVAAEGMHAIVRPGPYICAEWDNGGLPAWLFHDENVGIRRLEPTYVAALTTFLNRVYDIVAPRQIDHGGPVVLVQIENEYGAYGNDKDYLAELVRITRDAGIVVPLTTVDQPQPQMLENGSLPGLHLTASFGSRATERLATLREHQPTGPLMCMEFWNGWFDAWGSQHHVTTPDDSARELDTILAAGGSVNFYMFHGGTNFGLTNGADDKSTFRPTTTSYDYNAPLDEAGHPTAKYHAFRDVIARYAEVPSELPPEATTAPEITAPLTERSGFFGLVDQLGEAREFAGLPTFDDLGHYSGLALFSARLDGSGAGVLVFEDVRDRAWVYLDGAPVGILSRELHERAIQLPRAHGDELTILVEDQGRVNYGPRLGERKGLIADVTLDGVAVTGWTARPLDLDVVPTLALERREPEAASSVVARGEFTLDAPADLFLDATGWGKGFVWINGFALGRYWRRGPQETLYVPGPATRVGRNEVTLLELEVLLDPTIRFVDGPRLGPTEF